MFNLLIVDDSINELKYIQKHIIHYIELKGYAIIVETFLNEGTITIDVNKYDAIFLDIDMPKINGFDLATIINENNIKLNIFSFYPLQTFLNYGIIILILQQRRCITERKLCYITSFFV